MSLFMVETLNRKFLVRSTSEFWTKAFVSNLADRSQIDQSGIYPNMHSFMIWSEIDRIRNSQKQGRLKFQNQEKNLPKQGKSGLGIQSKEIISMHKTLCTLNFGLSFPTYNFTENLDNVLLYITHVYVISLFRYLIHVSDFTISQNFWNEVAATL